MNLLDLFSGIGAFSLGLERSGAFRTVAFCEVDPFCRRVLAKHWPEVPCYDDVRSLTAERLRADGISVDAICGGFPCTDISVAGKGAGITGPQSGLWSEFARLIGELRPRYVFVENVAALLGRGLGEVLGDLAALRYDAEWHCIPAAAVGAPHIRDRIWIIAYPQHSDADEFGSHRAGMHQQTVAAELRDQQERVAGSVCADVSNAGADRIWILAYPDDCEHHQRESEVRPPHCRAEQGRRSVGVGRLGPDISDPDSAGLPDWRQTGQQAREIEARWRVALAESERRSGPWWATEPDVGRVAHGVPARVDRLRSLGNSLIPQIAELIGRTVAAQHKERAA